MALTAYREYPPAKIESEENGSFTSDSRLEHIVGFLSNSSEGITPTKNTLTSRSSLTDKTLEILSEFGGDSPTGTFKSVRLLTDTTASDGVFMIKYDTGAASVIKVGDSSMKYSFQKELDVANATQTHERLLPFHAPARFDEVGSIFDLATASFSHASKNFSPSVPDFQIADYKELELAEIIIQRIGGKVPSFSNFIKDPVLHRMYILAQRHAFLTPLVCDNPLVASYNYTLLKSPERQLSMADGNRLYQQWLKTILPFYDEITGWMQEAVASKGMPIEQVVVHNDSRPENLVDPFTGKNAQEFLGIPRRNVCRDTLIDEGHTTLGFEFQDIAKALLEHPTIFNEGSKLYYTFQDYVNSYIFFRMRAETYYPSSDANVISGLHERLGNLHDLTLRMAYAHSVFHAGWDNSKGRNPAAMMAISEAIAQRLFVDEKNKLRQGFDISGHDIPYHR